MKLTIMLLLLMVLFLWERTKAFDYHYVGCFDYGGALGQDFEDINDITTAKTRCPERCQKTYFGVRREGDRGNSARCYCADTSTQNFKRDDRYCTFSGCGTGRNRCGGTYYISVFLTCPPKTWGPACESVCKCKYGTHCPRQSGLCPSGGCVTSWYGPACGTNIHDVACFPSRTIESSVKSEDDGRNLLGCRSFCESERTTYFALHDTTAGVGRCLCLSTVPWGQQESTCGEDSATVYAVCPIGKRLSTDNKCVQPCPACSESPVEGLCLVGGTCERCPPGLTGSLCVDDVNECNSGNDGCSHGCENNHGSYTCNCPAGYALNEDGRSCDDVDECSKETHGCDQTCNNTVGSYICTCRRGHVRAEGECTDVDECKEDNGGCSHDCDNSLGSYRCLCPEGLQLAAENHTLCVEPPSISSVGLIAGVIGGAALVVLLAVIIFGYFYIKRKSRSPEHKPGNSDQETVSFDKTLTSVRQPTGDNPSTTALRGSQLWQYVWNRTFDDFKADYTTITRGATKPWAIAANPQLKPKNRMKDILPYDDNRVALSVVGGDPLSDYINASYVRGYYPSDKFIACLGPRPATLVDFWRMIWEKDVPVIVMLTNFTENANSKCSEYFPFDGSKDYGTYKVRALKTQTYTHFVRRTFKLSEGGKERHVKHYHFITWPDHDVPENPMTLVYFLLKVREDVQSNKHTVVHCSAGVGRTGTFIALDHLTKQLEDDRLVDVYGCVTKLREQRVNMVQTVEQYVFLFKVLCELNGLGRTKFACTDLDQIRTAQRGKSATLKPQFELLEELATRITDDERRECLAPGNDSRNRNNTVLPRSAKRLFVSNQRGNSYINAVGVESFLQKQFFISTQIPMDNTIEDFWRLAYENECSAIVLLLQSNDPKSFGFVPSESGPVTWDGLSAEAGSVTTDGHVTVTDIRIKGVTAGDTAQLYGNFEIIDENDSKKPVATVRTVRLFTVLIDKKNQGVVPADVWLSLCDQVKKWKDLDGKSSGEVVCCMDGASLSGQYIVAHNLLEMVRAEREVDVYLTVRTAKQSRPEFIPSLQQYRAAYDFAEHLLEHSQENSLYGNF